MTRARLDEANARMELATKVLPIRPGVTGEPEETEAQKWARVRLGVKRVHLALGAEPAMAQLHIREAFNHLRGLGEE